MKSWRKRRINFTLSRPVDGRQFCEFWKLNFHCKAVICGRISSTEGALLTLSVIKYSRSLFAVGKM